MKHEKIKKINNHNNNVTFKLKSHISHESLKTIFQICEYVKRMLKNVRVPKPPKFPNRHYLKYLLLFFLHQYHITTFSF